MAGCIVVGSGQSKDACSLTGREGSRGRLLPWLSGKKRQRFGAADVATAQGQEYSVELETTVTSTLVRVDTTAGLTSHGPAKCVLMEKMRFVAQQNADASCSRVRLCRFNQKSVPVDLFQASSAAAKLVSIRAQSSSPINFDHCCPSNNHNATHLNVAEMPFLLPPRSSASWYITGLKNGARHPGVPP